MTTDTPTPPAPAPEPVERKYRSLRVVAALLTIVGWLVLVVGGAGVAVGAVTSTSQLKPLQIALVAVGGAIYVAVVSLYAFAGAAVIRLAMAVEENTRATAEAIGADRCAGGGSSMILAIDQGTTGTTCLVFDDEAELIGRAHREFDAALPAARAGSSTTPRRSGRSRGRWPARPWTTPARAAASCAASASPTSARPWSPGPHTGEPLHRALVWQDRRTAGALRRAARGGPRGRWCASAPASCSTPTSRAPRSSGCSNNVDGLRERAREGRAVSARSTAG